MADTVSAIPYGTAAQGQGLFGTGPTAAVWAYSPWDTSTVTAAAGVPAGTTPPTPVVAASSTIARGSLTCGTGTNASTGVLVSVTFGSTLPSTPVVNIAPTTLALASLAPAVTATSTTGFSVSSTAPGSSQGNTVYGLSWQMML
ncbi:MAG TPA: hypothetical protein VND44_12225 [Acidimicrobiales bacterium]|nr:hypothetical protein [Acidimicrobiales bacterium]